ncbi:MAG: methyl-accepting chemotaxis protein, partial [Microcystaceae cyanobacterium]
MAVVGAGIAISLVAGRDQLKRQATAELAVNSINYDIKVNQMSLGFRGQSDNPAIIQAAQLQSRGQPLPLPLRQQLQTILKNEVNNRKIEYATLVGKDARIIVNANRDRQGQTFDPDGLVKDVLALPRQIKVTTLIPTQDLDKEGAPYTQNIKTPQALIRFVLTPVQDPVTRQVLGVLVAGDVVNGKNPIVKGTVETFGGGYSGIYMTQPKGGFELVTSVLSEPGATPQSQPRLVNNVPLGDLSLLRQSQKSPKDNITGRAKIDRQQLTLALHPVLDMGGQPIAFLIRGTSETRLEALLQETFLLQLGVGVIVLLFSAFVASVLGRALTRPIKQLQETAQQLGTGEMG